MSGRLYRSRDRVLAGVAGGMADYFDVDPSMVRVLWAVLTFLSGGLLILVYILMAIIVPEEPERGPVIAGAGPAGSGGTEEGGHAAVTAGEGEAAPGAEAAPGGAPTAGYDWRAARDAERRARREARWAERGDRQGGAGAVVFGIILIVLGGIFLLREYVPALDWDQLWPIALIAVGAVLVFGSLRRRA
jgi:phage shock protein C